MNSIRQHVADYIDTDSPTKSASFETLAELLQIPFVRRYMDNEQFHQFSIARGHLIAEWRGGREWWVAGIVDGPVEGLAEWNRGIYEVWGSDGQALELPGCDVQSSCGDVVTLLNGTVLRRRGES